MRANKEKAPAHYRGFQRVFDSSNVNTQIYHKKQENQEIFGKKFQDALSNLPERGGGLHSALLGACNYGIAAGLSGEVLYREIAATGRPFKRNEISEAIQKAEREKAGQTAFKHKETICSGLEYSTILKEDNEKAAKLRDRLIKKGGEFDPFGAEVWECSNPHPEVFPHVGGLDGSECCSDMLLFLQELYSPEDLLYIGSGFEKAERQQEQIKTAAEWINFFFLELENIRQEQNSQQQEQKIYDLSRRFEYFVINPLSGQPLQSGSFRSDANVTGFRYVLLESDTLSLEKQLSLLNGLSIPVVALTYTGGKSIHALLDASACNKDTPIKEYSQWQKVIKENIFGQLAPLGFDRQTSNPARLSRLPGIYRPEKHQFQKLIYINKQGKTLCLKH